MERTWRAVATARDTAILSCRNHPVLAIATCATGAGMSLSFDLFASMGLWCITVLWIGQWMGGSRLFRWVGLLVAAVAVLEPLVVVAQDILGRPLVPLLDLTHLTLFAAICLLAMELFRRPLGHPSVAWAVRLGAILTLLGMAVHPTRGIPALGPMGGGAWRPAHLVGLYALQILPLFGWALSGYRRLRVSHQVTLVVVAAVSYSGVMLVLAWQATRGQPLLAPDPITVAALVVVLAGGASSAASVLAHAREVRHLHEVYTASERRQAMLAREQMARARRAALQQRVTQGLLSRIASERDRGAVPGATIPMRRASSRLTLHERPTEIELFAV